MIRNISENSNINLKIIKQVHGLVECEPIQYICHDEESHRFLLMIAVNKVQTQFLKKERDCFKSLGKMYKESVLEILNTGEFQQYFWVLYKFPNKLKIRNSLDGKSIKSPTIMEISGQAALANLLNGLLECVRESIVLSEEYRNLNETLGSCENVIVSSSVNKHSGNKCFIDRRNKSPVYFPSDLIQTICIDKKNKNVVQLYNSFLKRAQAIYRKLLVVSVERAEQSLTNIVSNMCLSFSIDNNKTKVIYVHEEKHDLIVNYEVVEGLHYAILHCFLTPLSYLAVKEIIQYIFKNENVLWIEYGSMVYSMGVSIFTEQAVIFLPDEIDTLRKKLSSKGRYNLKREKRIINEKIGKYSFLMYDGADMIPNEIVEKYFEFKFASHNRNFGISAREYIKQHNVNAAYVMKTGEEILAMCLSCERNEMVYFENFSYEPKYKEFSLGSVVYDLYLEELIKKRKKVVFLGNGQYDYKKRYGSYYFMAYTGRIFKYKVLDNLNILYRIIINYLKKLKFEIKEGGKS